MALKKVLIIGENSYIGNSFEKYINEINENQLYIDKISARDGKWEKYDFFGYDVVLHLSGIAHKRESKVKTKDYYKINKELAVNVAKKAKNSKVHQFIFMSTAAVYGSKTKIITKDTIIHPDTEYGRSKFEAEEEILNFHTDKFKVVIVRPPMVYGYGCKGNFPRLIKLAKIVPIFPDIQNKRSMIYIDNLCEFLKLIIMNEEWGYFHPQNTEYVCTSELVRIISDCLGRKIYFTKAFNWLIKLLTIKNTSIDKMFGDWYFDKYLDESFKYINRIEQDCQVNFGLSKLQDLGFYYTINRSLFSKIEN